MAQRQRTHATKNKTILTRTGLLMEGLSPNFCGSRWYRTLLRCNLIVVKVPNFDRSLFNLKNGSVSVSVSNAYPETGKASVQLQFANGSKLRADYWRVIKKGRAGISSFDHQQQYGLPAPLDSIRELQDELQNKMVIDAQLDKETGDLLFQFSDNIKLQVLNVTGYEVWEIHFPDGTGEYSNFAK